MAQNVMLQEALDAIAHGQKDRARDLLTRLLRSDQSNPDYWMWMSAVVETSKERIYCLQNVLRLEPDNRAARLGLILSGVNVSDSNQNISPFIIRKWSVAEEEALFLKKFARSRNKRRLMAYIGIASAVIVLILALVIGFGSRSPGQSSTIHLTITPRFRTATSTATQPPTATTRPRKTSSLASSPTPLWLLLKATYTPTPLYVNTPHPISEAYRAGLWAFQSGDLESMLQYMQQAAHDEPQSADLQFFVGESFRALGDNLSALAAYEKAIEVDPNFAPAYVGRARVNLELDPEAEIESDLQKAIDLDPDYIDSYLARAALRLAQEDYDAALIDLDEIELLAPQSPLLYLYRAQAFMAQGEDGKALENAQIAYDLDQTSLLVYLVLGQSSLLTGDTTHAINKLKTYLLYEPEDLIALTMLGQAYFEQGKDYHSAIASLNRALQLEDGYFPALLYRGLSYLKVNEGQLAVNDLFEARNLNRESFEASLGLGLGLYQTDRFEDAISQISASQALVKTDSDLAQVYYWRAIAREANGESRLAAEDWESLLTLERQFVSEAWITEAEEHLMLLTPSPTLSPTIVPGTPSPTPIHSTPHTTPSPARTKTPPQSPTQTPTIYKTPGTPPKTATKTPTS